jgi:CRP-like cAMP-binding protein
VRTLTSLPVRGYTSSLVRRLRHAGFLELDDEHALEESVAFTSKTQPRTDLVRQGDEVTSAHLILDGFACRYRYQSDGRRQILALLLPGDLCDVRLCLLPCLDHSIGTFTWLRTARIPLATMRELLERPRIAGALWWSTLADESITRDWIVNVGHRSALQRLCHLFCEVFTRMSAVGLALDSSCAFPLTQADLSDALGLSAVHVNRMLMSLRRERLADLRHHKLTIFDQATLRDSCGFDDRYLNLSITTAAHDRARIASGSTTRRAPAFTGRAAADIPPAVPV